MAQVRESREPLLNAAGDPAIKSRLPKVKNTGEPFRNFLLLEGVHFDHNGYHRKGEVVSSNQDLIAFYGRDKFRPLFPYGPQETRHNSRVFETDEEILAGSGVADTNDNHPSSEPSTPPAPPSLKGKKVKQKPTQSPVVESPTDGEGPLALSDMGFEQLQAVADREGISTEACHTKDDYIKVITAALQE